MGGQVRTPKLSLEGGGQLRTPKLSLADAGGGAPPSSDIVTTFALFLVVRLPLVSQCESHGRLSALAVRKMRYEQTK